MRGMTCGNLLSFLYEADDAHNCEEILISSYFFLAHPKKEDSQIDIINNTMLAFFIEFLYQKAGAGSKDLLLKIRQHFWDHHFGVPSVGFLRSFRVFLNSSLKGTIDKLKASLNNHINSFLIDSNLLVLKDLNQIQIPEPESNGLFIKTLNSQGYMTTKLDKISNEFVEFCKEGQEKKLKVLDIGAAYGVASVKALEMGATVYINDLDPDQLYIAHSSTGFSDKAEPLPGNFLEELVFEENYFDAILICRVLHFLTGNEIERALEKMKYWLKPNGKIFAVVETPFLSNWKTFLPIYIQRKMAGEAFPGEIHNTYEFEKNRTKAMPKFIHFLDDDILRKLLVNSGFNITKVEYINRKDEFPSDIILDGKESVGAIAVKN